MSILTGLRSILLALFIVSFYSGASTMRSLVLVTSAQSKVSRLTIQEARKLFLGVPLEKAGIHPVALLNTSDPFVYQVFLQKVAFMSEANYENQILSVVFRLGGKRPSNYSDLSDLIEALQSNPDTVTYVWDNQIKANAGIKTVSVLWQDSAE